jgi:uncharacterized protein YjbJ (UPF0337 family)
MSSRYHGLGINYFDANGTLLRLQPHGCSQPAASSLQDAKQSAQHLTPSITGTVSARRRSSDDLNPNRSASMDKEHIMGAMEKAKGDIKDATGKVLDDKEMQAKGKMDKAKGEARQAAGDAKDTIKKATD